MKRADQCCGNCNAFMEDPGRKPNPPPDAPLQGFCRAHPAEMVQTMMQVGSVIDTQRRMVPAVQGMILPTSAAGWCREWEPEDSDHWKERP